ncbi:MAG: ABC transporter permease [Ilumatobacteraceae bacterium]|nr:ABC transporter permease [Ilumatobacteraceae bacterium]
MSSASELIARRELLWNLTLRELRGRYKRSLLGWGWSLLNPIAFMLVYTFAFSIVIGANPDPGVPSGNSSYAFFLLCGLLPWSFFNVSVGEAMGSIVSNGALVRKVAFPREHLVVATILAGMFTLAIELTVLSIALALFGYIVLQWLPLVILTSLVLAVFAAGFGLALAAANVYFRDMTYLWGIVVQAWFFSTPIVYRPGLVAERLDEYPTIVRIYNDLPMAVVVRVFRDLMFNLRMPRLIDYGLLTGYAVVALLFGWWLFDKLEGRFAEEL